MKIHKFRAASLQEALQSVREELGPDAEVMQTREVKTNRLGIFSSSMIEVDAGVSLREPLPANFAAGPAPEVEHPLAVETSRGVEPAAAASLAPSTNSSVLEHPNIRTLFEELSSAGIQERLAHQTLELVADRCEASDLQILDLLRAKANEAIAEQINVGGVVTVTPGQQQIVAITGGPGVGKTASLSKIAAGLRIDVGCRIGLLTFDTFRMGAVDQLLQFSEFISSPIEVVNSLDQVTNALSRLQDCDVVLVDTTGKSFRNSGDLADLDAYLRAVKPAEIALVLSATSSVAHARHSLQAFSKAIRPTNLILSKLDEAVDFGSWFELLRSVELPISYLGTGPKIPDDLMVAHPRRVAREITARLEAK